MKLGETKSIRAKFEGPSETIRWAMQWEENAFKFAGAEGIIAHTAPNASTVIIEQKGSEEAEIFLRANKVGEHKIFLDALGSEEHLVELPSETLTITVEEKPVVKGEIWGVD